MTSFSGPPYSNSRTARVLVGIVIGRNILAARKDRCSAPWRQAALQLGFAGVGAVSAGFVAAHKLSQCENSCVVRLAALQFRRF
jgi:hypothetical protein